MEERSAMKHRGCGGRFVYLKEWSELSHGEVPECRCDKCGIRGPFDFFDEADVEEWK